VKRVTAADIEAPDFAAGRTQQFVRWEEEVQALLEAMQSEHKCLFRDVNVLIKRLQAELAREQRLTKELVEQVNRLHRICEQHHYAQ
jgi:predicted outer membrane protein